MVDTLFFVDQDRDAAEEVADYFRERGWNVDCTQPAAPDALDRIAETSPVAAVFCLDGGCADDVLSLAEHVLSDERVPRPLMVFVDGSPTDITQARAAMPFGVFVHKDELAWVLRRLVGRS